MQSNIPTIIFLKNHRIPIQYNIISLHGQVRFIDSDNYVHICTIFDRGLCIWSQVFLKKHRKLKNVVLEVNQDRVMYLHGREVEEYSFDENLVYKGGYLGYYRHGLGSQYKKKQTKSAIERGLWHKDKKQGKFILKIEQPNYKFTTLNEYKDDILQRCISLELNNQLQTAQYVIDQLQTNHEKQPHKIQLKSQQIGQKLFYMKQQQAYLQKLGQLSIKQQYLQQFSKLSMDMDYDNKVLIDKKQDGMLSQSMCQFYLDYLSHQQHYQKPYTLIVNLYISDLIHKYQNGQPYDLINKYHNGQPYQSLKQKISNYMKKYRNNYNIWVGLWKRLILPLSINNHFSFILIVFNIKQKDIKCQVYDSTLNHNKQIIYQNILKQFLMIELECYIKGLLGKQLYDKQLIDQMQMEYRQIIEGLDLEKGNFPRQKSMDNQSCGVFMLCGIADLMQLHKINFKESQISHRRASILKTLSEKLLYFQELQ